MTFISLAKHSSGNEDGNTASVPTASTNVPTASASVATISQDTACAYIASQSSGSQIKFKDINQIDEDDMEEMDIKWNMALLSMRADKFWKKTKKKISLQGSDVAGFDKLKSYMANEEEDHALVTDEVIPTEFALMANTSAESKVFDNSLCSKDYKKNNDSLNSKITDLTDKLFDANNYIYHYKLALVQVESRLVEYKEREVKYIEKIRTLEFYNESNKECIETLKRKLETLKQEKEGVDGKLAGLLTASKDLDNLIKSQRAPWVPTVNRNYPPVNRKFSTGSRNFPAAKRKFPTASRKFPTGSIKCYTADMGMKGNAIKPSACNISYLSDFEPFDGGYVSFGQGGCKITGKGTIKTGKLEFENVYFVKDLKYNLFSVSQTCDNKNNVMFTDSECIVLGRDFKLLHDANILLRTLRQHNMYYIDLNNIVPHRDLTCLVAKASTDECMLWHRRLETPSLDNILTLTNRFEDILRGKTNSDESNGVEANVSSIETTIIVIPTPTLRIHKDHPKSQIIGHMDTPIQTRNKSKEVEAMQEELLQFKIQNVWTLVDCPKRVRPIGTKWVLKNKKDERGIVIRNKARLVAQGHTQEERINYDEVFAPVARIEAIRLFLAYASFMGIYSVPDGCEECLPLWHQVTPKECYLHAVKRIFSYLKDHPKLGLWYPKESPFDLVAYSDSDYGGATQDRKSTTGGCQFLGRRLISWQCKKQTIVATSTSEAEYVAASSCCRQVLWIQNQLRDYGDCFEKKLINVDHIHTDENVTDLLTKPFDAGRFQYLVVEHAM
nr:hypothetical protein [Tanacetum cinerariifolium]